jgi:uncharacterized membrane protein
MSDLVAIAYSDLETARRAAAGVAKLQETHEIELEDLVVVERREDGKVKLHQPSITGIQATRGALWGGVIGLLFLVPLFGMAVGAATGAAAGAATDLGVNDEFMKKLGAELEPGKAAVVMLIRKVTVDKVLPKIQIPGTVIQTSLDHETEEQLTAALGAAG